MVRNKVELACDVRTWRHKLDSSVRFASIARRSEKLAIGWHAGLAIYEARRAEFFEREMEQSSLEHDVAYERLLAACKNDVGEVRGMLSLVSGGRA